MDKHIIGVYLSEVQSQCNFGTNAIKALNNVLPRLTKAGQDGNPDLRNTLHAEVFRTIHSFLTHASNVSRLFWPTLPKHRKNESDEAYTARCMAIPKIVRGKILRTEVGLPDDGHELKSRKLRDHLEHFDERLDQWQNESVRKNYIQDLIGPKGSIVGTDDGDMMRWFDPSAKKMRFRGEEFDLQALANALVDVLEKVQAKEAQLRDWANTR